jgi:hypothetical protein
MTSLVLFAICCGALGLAACRGVGGGGFRIATTGHFGVRIGRR